MGTFTKNLKLETPNYTDNADIPALTKKNNEIIDSEMIKRANGLDYNEQTGVLQLTGNNSKVGSPIQIKNNLPVTSMASGTELKVNNYKQLIKFAKEGKTEQKTYTGKNLFYDTPSSTTSNGITLTKNSDGSFTLNGTSTDVSVFNFTLPKVLLAGTYTFSIEGSDNIPGPVFLRARDNNGAMVSTDAQVQGNNTTKNSHTFTSEKEIVTVALNITKAGQTFNNFVIYPQLEIGSKATEFEPYVGATPSPNPDYPQQIENIEGVENIWFGAGSSTVNGVTFTKNDDGSYDITGTATADANCYGYANVIDSKLVNNKVYTISINKLYSSSVGILTEALADSTWVSHAIPPLVINNNISNYKYITIPDNVTKIRYGLRVTKGTTVDVKGLKIQLEEGTIAHTFVLPGSNYLQLENKSKNILPHSLSQGSWNTTSTNTRVANYSNILIKSGTYTFSTDIDLTNYVVWVGTSTQKLPHLNWNIINEIKSWSAIEKITFTIEKESYFLVMYRKKDDSTITPDEIKNIKQQLEIGPEATEFEPYQKKIINIDLKGNNLCSNKDKTIKDELVIENGKAKINKKFGEYIFTGNEIFSFADSNTRIKIDSNLLPQLANVYIPQPKTSSNRTPSFCTHYILSSQDNVVKGSNKFAFSQWSNQKFIYFPADYSTIEEFKAKLKSLYDAGTPVIIQYPLSETEGVDLGEIDFDLIENSTLTCEEETNMQIDYLTIDSNIFVQDSLDGSSSQKAPSVDAIKKYFGKKVYDKDANGWIKIEFFDHIEYVYTAVVNKTFNSGWGYTDNVPFPVGVSSLGDRILTSSVICTDAAIKLNAGQYHNGKQGIGINYTNSYETALTKECIYDFRILEYK